MGSDQQPAVSRATIGLGTLEGLFSRLGELRDQSRKDLTLVVIRASGCVSDATQEAKVRDNLCTIFEKMADKARGQAYRMNGLDFGFLLSNTNEDAREFIPNARIALFKVLTRSGAGQSTTEGDGLSFDHYDLEKDFNSAAKFIITYIKQARSNSSARSKADGMRLLSEDDLKAVIAAYRELGAQKFLKSFARGQPICVSTDRGVLKPKMTEFYISIDHLRRPFFEGVDLRASGDRFIELTKILDSIMLNAFPTLSKASNGKQISINLNVQSVFSKAFDTFVEKTPSEVMRNVVVEFRQDDAVLNYDGYAVAREHLRNKGAHIAIDQIAPSAIGLINIGFLDAEIAKLNWQSDSEKDFYERQAVVDSFRRTGIKPILSRVDQERAHNVGMDLGIEMYQGFLIDDRLKTEARHSAASVV